MSVGLEYSRFVSVANIVAKRQALADKKKRLFSELKDQMELDLQVNVKCLSLAAVKYIAAYICTSIGAMSLLMTSKDTKITRGLF